jgi:hypothetical protein
MSLLKLGQVAVIREPYGAPAIVCGKMRCSALAPVLMLLALLSKGLPVRALNMSVLSSLLFVWRGRLVHRRERSELGVRLPRGL